MSLPISSSSPPAAERNISTVIKPLSEDKREDSTFSRMLANRSENPAQPNEPSPKSKTSPLARLISSLKEKRVENKDKCDNILQTIKSELDRPDSKDSPSLKLSKYRRTIRDSPGSENDLSSNLALPKESSWTKEIEAEFIRFSRVCTDDAEGCQTTAKKNDRLSKAIQISLILFGASSLYVAITQLSVESQKILHSILGGLTGITTGVYGLLAPTKKATLASDSSVSLNRLARKLKLQVLLPENRRETNPLKLILEAEDVRDKILKRKY